jgi:hypothetical protein
MGTRTSLNQASKHRTEKSPAPPQNPFSPKECGVQKRSTPQQGFLPTQYIRVPQYKVEEAADSDGQRFACRLRSLRSLREGGLQISERKKAKLYNSRATNPDETFSLSLFQQTSFPPSSSHHKQAVGAGRQAFITEHGSLPRLPP